MDKFVSSIPSYGFVSSIILEFYSNKIEKIDDIRLISRERNLVYCIKSNGNYFFLKIYELNYSSNMDHIKSNIRRFSNTVTIPKLINTNNFKPSVIVFPEGERFFELFEAIEGKKIDINSSNQIKSLALSLGNIHNDNNSDKIFKPCFEIESIRDFFSCDSSEMRFYFNLIDKYQLFLEENKINQVTLCHGDCHFDNIFIVNDKISMIDFEFSCYTTPLWDIGTIGWSLVRSRAYEKLLFFVSVYCSVNKDVQIEHLNQYIILRELWLLNMDIQNSEINGHSNINNNALKHRIEFIKYVESLK